ncbi:MAG: hypothetical protein JO250_21060 [Armatimonadetes bacterium]|nr:hypothetical protein [Armatimonadota bacterium]
MTGQETGLEADVETILERQDEAMALLERLRMAEPAGARRLTGGGGGRRDFRRWPTPDGVTLELHDGIRWHAADCVDLGVGGGRVKDLPEWANGPTPARLKAGREGSVLALADVMWHDSHAETSGLRFEFLDSEEREAWAGLLIDALLSRYSLG